MGYISEIKDTFQNLYQRLCNIGTVKVTQHMSSYINHFVRLKGESSTSFFFCTYGSNLDYIYFLCCLESTSFEPLWLKKVPIENPHDYILDVVACGEIKKRTRKCLLKFMKQIQTFYPHQPLLLYNVKPIHVFGQHVESPFHDASLEKVDAIFQEYLINQNDKLGKKNGLLAMA